MRIGIYGGSFDPIHAGHVAILKAAKKTLKLDRAYVVPSYRTPLRGPGVATPTERLAMVQLALRGLAWAEASGVEIRRKGRSYTIDTLRSFRRRFGARAELYFILGSDAARGFSKWKNPKGILALCRFAVAQRAGHARPGSGFVVFRMKPSPVSASAIREAIARGNREPAGWLSPRVKSYIARRGLYRKPLSC